METCDGDRVAEHMVFTGISTAHKSATGTDLRILLPIQGQKSCRMRKKDQLETHGINTFTDSSDLARETTIESSRSAINTISIVSPLVI